MKAILTIAVIGFLISSCKKEETLSSIPKIEMRSITPQNIVAFQDSITLQVYYEDGDGNLGENNPDVKNVFITDSRSGIVYQYRISQLAPSGESRAIRGTFTVVIPYSTITSQNTQENFSYNLYVVDRAGNRSNEVTSNTITISSTQKIISHLIQAN